jgi:hypothetical protein
MHRVLAAVVAALALVAAGVPLADAMPPRCAECCRHDAMHAAEASMPNCCGIAPAERPVARDAAAQRAALAVTADAPRSVHVQPAPIRVLPQPPAPPRVTPAQVLRI